MDQKNMYDEVFATEEADSRTEAFTVGVILRIILAITTAGFAWVYGYGLLDWVLPEFYARVGTTIIYVFGIDFMAYEWPRLVQAQNATTKKQIGLAHTGWLVSTAMSVIVTLVFTVLVFSEFVTVEGKLKNAVDVMALAIGIGMPIFQGVWYMRYENASIKSIEAKQNAHHKAMKNLAGHMVRTEHEKERLGRMVTSVRKQLPGKASGEAEEMADDYFDSAVYNRAPNHNPPIGYPTTPREAAQQQQSNKPDYDWEEIARRLADMPQDEFNQRLGRGLRDTWERINGRPTQRPPYRPE